MVVKLVGPGIASGGRSLCTVVGMSGTNNSSSCCTTILLACKFELQWCGDEAQSAGASMELAGSLVIRLGRVDIAGKITKLEITFLGTQV